MKTQPIRPAQIAYAEGEPTAAPQMGSLQQRWAGARDFTVLETAFGRGDHFLALWQAWRDDPARCDRLHVVSLALHPPTREDLARVQASSPRRPLAEGLVAAWPPLAPGLHRLCFEGGRVQLTLALGDARHLLPLLQVQADALWLDGGVPGHDPAVALLPLLKALARRCKPGASISSGSGSDLGETPQAALVARHTPRAGPPATAAPASALVIGAGLAGAHAAQALAAQGLAVTVLEAAGAPALGASGNRAGLFHGTLDADDSPYARLHRCAALWAAQCYRQAVAAGVPGQVQGLLRLATPRQGRTDPHTLAERQALPTDYVALLEAAAASALAGLPLQEACWFYPSGGWVSPADAVRHALCAPGIECRLSAGVARLQRAGGGWAALDSTGQEIARAPVTVIAAAESSQRLLDSLGQAQPPLPLARSRGQVTELAGYASNLRLPLAGDGYAIPLPGGLMCGATRDAGDEDPALRERDHARNLERLARLTGIATGLPGPIGRVGWRLHSDDRLPVAGAVPLAAMPAGTRLDQARLLPREPGLFLITALGARGITWAPLLGALVAAQACGTPWPLEQDLADAIDPGRWHVKRARAGSGPGR